MAVWLRRQRARPQPQPSFTSTRKEQTPQVTWPKNHTDGGREASRVVSISARWGMPPILPSSSCSPPLHRYSSTLVSISRSAASSQQRTASLPPQSAGCFSHFGNRQAGVCLFCRIQSLKQFEATFTFEEGLKSRAAAALLSWNHLFFSCTSAFTSFQWFSISATRCVFNTFSSS